MTYIKQMGSLTSSGVVATPDYSKRASRVKGTTYTASQDGWVYVYTRGGDSTNGLNTSITLNGAVFKQAYRIGDYGAAGSSIIFPVKKGDTYALSGATDSMEMWFIPPVGGGGN